MPKKAQKDSALSPVMSAEERHRRVAQLEKDAKQLQREVLDMERRLLAVLKEQEEHKEEDALKKARKRLTNKSR